MTTKRTGGRSGTSGAGKGATPTRPSGRDLTVRVKTAARRKTSSTRWLQRQLNDPYVVEARRRGLRSRAAFKLMQLDEKFDLLRPGDRVVDLGAAPGGWTQVAIERCRKGTVDPKVVAVDYLPMEPVAEATVLELDFLDDDAPERIIAALDGQANVVLSDMAAPTTGHHNTDHLRIMGLAEAAYEFAERVLAPGGTFISKLFQGGAEKTLLDRLKRDFKKVRHAKPEASRSDSSEMYVVATGFRGNPGGDSSGNSGGSESGPAS